MPASRHLLTDKCLNIHGVAACDDHNILQIFDCNSMAQYRANDVFEWVPTSGGLPVKAKTAQAAVEETDDKRAATGAQTEPQPNPLSCDEFCQSGSHGRGVPIGTAPFCGASCANDCHHGNFCQEPWSEGHGTCASGHKICCCAQP
jgi:hypothetical protein